MGPKTLPDLNVIDRHEFLFPGDAWIMTLFELALSGPEAP
jgi:hypothetical protein